MLRRAKIGDVKRSVQAEHADEGDRGEMETFGDHLGADEDVGFMGAELFEEGFVAVFLFCRVFVHPEGPDFGKHSVE